MLYFDFRPGDFYAMFHGLDYEGQGIAVALISRMTTTEKPIKTQWVSLGFQNELREKAKAILETFFVETEEGWILEPYWSQVHKFQEISKRNKENGKLGGRPKKAVVVSEETQTKATGFSEETQTKATQKATNKPINQETKKESSTPYVNADGLDDQIHEQDPDMKEGLFTDETPIPTQKKAIATCPYEKIKALYAEVLPELAQPVMLSSARKTAMKARWQDIFNEEKITTEEEGLNCLRNFFGMVRESKFLMGRTSKFKATLDWLMKQENFLKVCEGRYRG